DERYGVSRDPSRDTPYLSLKRLYPARLSGGPAAGPGEPHHPLPSRAEAPRRLATTHQEAVRARSSPGELEKTLRAPRAGRGAPGRRCNNATCSAVAPGVVASARLPPT